MICPLPRPRGALDSLFTSSVIAIRPKTGEIVCHYQYTPNDIDDVDGADEQLLVERSGCYLLEVHAQGMRMIESLMSKYGVHFVHLGRVSPDPILEISQLMPNRSRKMDCHVFVDELTRAWRGTLDW